MYLQLAKLLMGSIMSLPKTNWNGIFLLSGGTYIVLRNLLPLGFPSMGQHYLHMFLVDFIYVQGSLLLDVVSMCLCLLVVFWGKQS